MSDATISSIAALTAELDVTLAEVDRRYATEYPGDRVGRQPIHTVYIPADRFTAGTIASWGSAALDSLERFGDDIGQLADVTGLPVAVLEDLLPRVAGKLVSEPIEDLRVDFEDGYGTRPDEDAAALTAGQLLGRELHESPLRPSRYGIRFKSFDAAHRARGVRTLWLFLDALNRSVAIDDRLVVTLPKVTAVGQVEAMVHTCARLERSLGLPTRTLRFEIQIETPQSIVAADGTVLVARLIHAADGRCSGLHYGTYDYSAACGIAGAHQSMEHPAADYAKAVMQVAAAGTGVELSDGSTNVVPHGDRATVHAAWKLHARLVRRSLERGFYQGWDLHPAQLPTRYLATYAFYRAGLPDAAARLDAYAHSTDAGFLDEPATARALATFVLRGLDCGAIAPAEAYQLTGYDRQGLVALTRPAASPSTTTRSSTAVSEP